MRLCVSNACGVQDIMLGSLHMVKPYSGTLFSDENGKAQSLVIYSWSHSCSVGCLLLGKENFQGGKNAWKKVLT